MSSIICLRATGAHRLVLTGGVALNARRQHAAARTFRRGVVREGAAAQGPACICGCRRLRATPASQSAPLGCSRISPVRRAALPMTHAFYCGTAPSFDDIAAALKADDVASSRIGDISTPEGRDAVADLMAFMVAQNGVIALYQGAGRDRTTRARPSLDLRQPLRSRGARAAQRARQIPRGDPPAGADGDAGSGA